MRIVLLVFAIFLGVTLADKDRRDSKDPLLANPLLPRDEDLNATLSDKPKSQPKTVKIEKLEMVDEKIQVNEEEIDIFEATTAASSTIDDLMPELDAPTLPPRRQNQKNEQRLVPKKITITEETTIRGPPDAIHQFRQELFPFLGFSEDDDDDEDDYDDMDDDRQQNSKHLKPKKSLVEKAMELSIAKSDTPMTLFAEQQHAIGRLALIPTPILPDQNSDRSKPKNKQPVFIQKQSEDDEDSEDQRPQFVPLERPQKSSRPQNSGNSGLLQNSRPSVLSHSQDFTITRNHHGETVLLQNSPFPKEALIVMVQTPNGFVPMIIRPDSQNSGLPNQNNQQGDNAQGSTEDDGVLAATTEAPKKSPKKAEIPKPSKSTDNQQNNDNLDISAEILPSSIPAPSFGNAEKKTNSQTEGKKIEIPKQINDSDEDKKNNENADISAEILPSRIPAPNSGNDDQEIQLDAVTEAPDVELETQDPDMQPKRIPGPHRHHHHRFPAHRFGDFDRNDDFAPRRHKVAGVVRNAGRQDSEEKSAQPWLPIELHQPGNQVPPPKPEKEEQKPEKDVREKPKDQEEDSDETHGESTETAAIRDHGGKKHPNHVDFPDDSAGPEDQQ